jgi:drug/metabolite transporter (DMT)-like permease
MGYSSTVLICILMMQNFTTLLILKVMDKQDQIEYQKEIAIHWMPCVLFFCCNIFTSLKSLAYINVPTFTIFRNVQPLFAIIIDLFLRKQEVPNNHSLFFLFMILYGAYIYAKNDVAYDPLGYFWAIFHVLSMSLYAVLVKIKTCLPNSETQMKACDMSYYNNLLSLPLLTLLFLIEMAMSSSIEFDNLFITLYDCAFNKKKYCFLSLLVSFGGAYAVSLYGFEAQKILSPISWLTFNNISKIPAILLAISIWGPNLNSIECIGLSLSLLGGYSYSLSQQNLLGNSNFRRSLLFMCLFLCLFAIFDINTLVNSIKLYLTT